MPRPSDRQCGLTTVVIGTTIIKGQWWFDTKHTGGRVISLPPCLESAGKKKARAKLQQDHLTPYENTFTASSH